MENREEVPTQNEILKFILGWQQRPEEPVLEENQYTIARLVNESGHEYAWCKKRLYAMYQEGLCEREVVLLRTKRIVVYTFNEIPTF